MRSSILPYIISFILLSCQKEIEQEKVETHLSFGSKGQVYLSMTVVDTLLTSSFNMTYPNWAPGYKASKHATLCYDIEKDTTIWFKLDTMFVTSPYPSDAIAFLRSGSQYHKNFKIGAYLIRILAKEEFAPVGDPNNLHPNGVYTGIYLEKRDIYTGNIVLMKKLLEPGEFISGVNHNKFTLTNVINIGNKFYFGTNNNQLYCFDDQGVLHWKKPGFNPRISGTSPQMGYIYSNSNKLSYLGSDGKLNLVDANTGNIDWAVSCSPYQESFEILMTNKYLFAFSRDLINRYNISDGHNGINDYISTGSGYPNMQPFSSIVNDSSVCFWTDRTRLLSIGSKLTEVNGIVNVNRPKFGKYLSKFPTSFFTVTHNMINSVPESIMRIDFTIPNPIVWEHRFTGDAGFNVFPSIDDVITNNNNLYVVSTANHINYNYIPSNIAKRFGNSLYLYVLNPATGNIISKETIFSHPQYSIINSFAITYGDN